MSLLRRAISTILTASGAVPHSVDVVEQRNNNAEYPQTSIADFYSWMVAFGGSSPSAGVVVTERSAMTLSAVFACVRVLSEDAAKVPIEILRRVTPEQREPLRSHVLHRLLNVEANPEMSAFTFRETLTAHALAWGNGYAEIVRTGDGTPVALWPLTPDRVEIHRDPAGRLYYLYRGDRKQTSLPASDVLHVRGLGWDGLKGYSVVRQARESLGLAKAAETFGNAFFANGIRPSGVLQHPGALKKEARDNLRASIQSQQGGAMNVGRFMLLEEGMTWQSIGIAPEDAQFLQTRQFQVPEVCRWFRVPPHKIGDLTRATFSNIEHQSIEYVTDSLQPWWVRWESEINRKLLGAGEGDLAAEHVETELTRGDTKSRYEAYKIGRDGGWLSANDVRRREGENTIDGGDVYLTPVNMTAKPTGADDTKKQSDSSTGTRAATHALNRVLAPFRALLEDQIAGLQKVEHDRGSRAKGGVEAWAASFYPEHRDHVRARVFIIAEAMASAIESVCVRSFNAGDMALMIAERHVERALSESRSRPLEIVCERKWAGELADEAIAWAIKQATAGGEDNGKQEGP